MNQMFLLDSMSRLGVIEILVLILLIFVIVLVVRFLLKVIGKNK